MSRAAAIRFLTASEKSISPNGVLCDVTSYDGVERHELCDGPAMWLMRFLASMLTPTEFKCTVRRKMVRVDVAVVDKFPMFAGCD